jgi:ATP phosphoribosyltransferase regulatory subunit
MTDPTADLLPTGLADRLPAAARALTRARRAALEVLDAHGYDRVIPPLVEFERSLATRMSGVATRRMVRFVDPASLRTLSLRSDLTVQVGRISATSLAERARPLRLCYSGEVMTIAADQLDPRRERLQLGAELIGSDSAAAAAEVVALAIEALGAAGATGISVDFTLPDLVDTLAANAIPLAPDRVDAVRTELDAKDAGGLREAGGDAYLPLLYAAGPFDSAIARLTAIDTGGTLASRIAGLREIAERVGASARVTLDPTERHGFQYQSWFGFSLYADGVRGALGRGGTYTIHGSEEQATGFTLYIDSLADALGEADGGDLLYLPLGHDADAAARLRAIGWRTVAALAMGEDPAALGCTHVLEGADTRSL